MFCVQKKIIFIICVFKVLQCISKLNTFIIKGFRQVDTPSSADNAISTKIINLYLSVSNCYILDRHIHSF